MKIHTQIATAKGGKPARTARHTAGVTRAVCIHSPASRLGQLGWCLSFPLSARKHQRAPQGRWEFNEAVYDERSLAEFPRIIFLPVDRALPVSGLLVLLLDAVCSSQSTHTSKHIRSTMSASPEALDARSLSDEISVSTQKVPPAVATPNDAAARDDVSHGGRVDVEPPLEDDAAELVGERSCSASLMAPSFELNDGPTSPEPDSSGDQGES